VGGRWEDRPDAQGGDAAGPRAPTLDDGEQPAAVPHDRAHRRLDLARCQRHGSHVELVEAVAAVRAPGTAAVGTVGAPGTVVVPAKQRGADAEQDEGQEGAAAEAQPPAAALHLAGPAAVGRLRDGSLASLLGEHHRAVRVAGRQRLVALLGLHRHHDGRVGSGRGCEVEQALCACTGRPCLFYTLAQHTFTPRSGQLPLTLCQGSYIAPQTTSHVRHVARCRNRRRGQSGGRSIKKAASHPSTTPCIHKSTHDGPSCCTYSCAYGPRGPAAAAS
jgi:hypothetical protein